MTASPPRDELSAEGRDVLILLATETERNGWYPQRGSFRTKENHQRIDHLVKGGLVELFPGDCYILTAAGLRCIRDASPFAEAELKRAAQLLAHLEREYNAKRSDCRVEDVRRALEWPEQNDVRRAAVLLRQHFPRAVWFSTIPPQILSPMEDIWHAEVDSLLNDPPNEPSAPAPAEALPQVAVASRAPPAPSGPSGRGPGRRTAATPLGR